MANKLLLYQASIFLVLYVGYAFYYYTRKSIVFMLPHFGRNTTNSIEITKNDIGIIISSQNLAYSLSKLVGGFLSDTVSCRVLFGAGLFVSGILNIAFKKEIQIYTIYGLSVLIGLTQGSGWPCCGKLIQNWFPSSKFGTCWSILSTSANLAGALGPLVATSIALKYHWSYGFMIPGFICMSVGYLAILIVRNRPSEVGLEDFDSDNENIKMLYERDDDSYNEDSSGDDDSVIDEDEKIGVIERTKMFLNYSYFVSICLSFFAVQLIKTLMSDWSQTYLIKSIKINPYKASYFVSIFELSGIVGSVVSGVLTDYIYSRQMKKSSSISVESIRIRMAANLVYLVFMIASLHMFTFYLGITSSNLLLVSIAFAMGFLCYGCISLLGMCAMEFAPKKFSGSSHAIAALASNLGAVFAGIPFGLISNFYSWRIAYFVIEVLAVFVALIAFLTRNRICKFDTIPIARKTQ